MRLIICVKRDLHGCLFLNRLLPCLAGHPLRVLLADKTRAAEQSVPELAELAYLERTLPLQTLFPALDRQLPATGEWTSFAGLAARHGVDCRVVADINSAATIAELRAFAPDLMISARFSQIFTPATIATARYGVVNVHPGELPRYAGLFAPMRSVAEGQAELVCCLHYIDAGIDSGPIIAQRRLPYRRPLGLLSQIAEIYPLAIDPLLALLDGLARGEPPRASAQDKRLRCYRSAPDATEVRAFLDAGHRLWTPEGYDALLARFVPGAQTGSAFSSVSRCSAEAAAQQAPSSSSRLHSSSR